MKKKHLLSAITVVIIIACSAVSWGAGYVISAHSVRSYALNNAYVAFTDAADSAYFNPANMVWLEDGVMIDLGATYAHNTSVEFDGTVLGVPSSAGAKSEDSILPFVHLVSPKVGDWRFGLSIMEPAGMSKRWDSLMQMISAEESYLGVIEINPSVAYMITPRLSASVGVRFLYAEAELKAQLPPGMDPILVQGYRQDMDGDTWEEGFNLALTFKVTDSLRLAATYRSEINMDIEGTGSGYTTNPFDGSVYTFNDASGKTSLPLPANSALAISKTFDKTSLEFVYERTFWSAYDVLDLSFDDPLIELTFGQPRPQDWDDTNSFRVGVSYQFSDSLKLMGGASYEETPVPAQTIGFDIPESDILWFSLGAAYSFNPNMELGFACSYGYYKERTIEVADANVNGIVGTFNDSSFISATASFRYLF